MSLSTRLLAVASLSLATTFTFLGQPPTQAAGLSLLPNVLPGLSLATDLGPASPTQAVSFVVALNRPDPAGELAFINAVHDPSNAAYRKFLSPADFAARFGVPAAQRTALRTWLSNAGMTVTDVAPAGDLVSVRGTVAQIDRAFGTSIDDFTYQGVPFFANTVGLTEPTSLGILGVLGLNSLQKFTVPPGPKAGQTNCLSTICTGQTTPKDLWSVYDTGNLRGKGQGIAMFGEGDSAATITDLRQFEAENGLPQIPVTVKHPVGDTNFTDTSGAQEWDIDTQASSGMAPDATSLTMYFGSDLSDPDVAKLFSLFVNDPTGPQQASASFGECEQLPAPLPAIPSIASLPVGPAGTSTIDAVLTQIEQQGVAEGKSIFASTGDTGSSCPLVYAPVLGAGNGVLNQAVPVTNSPASLPWSVAVGGTVLYTDGQGHRAKEYAWTFSGGGSDLWVDAPSYQQGVAGNNIPCVTDLKPCRGIPDISAQSGDALTNGYNVVMAGKDSPGGGTSLSAPLAQGLWADVQSASTNPAGFGFANFTYYRAGKSSSYGSTFFDVGGPSSQTLPGGNGAYLSGTGWDYVTGWGTQDVRGLVCFDQPASCGKV